MEDVEDFYPLSPLQQGLLFHTLVVPGSGAYVSQLCCEINGPLNIPALERAWQRVIDRHGVLRSFFVWQGVKEPIQVVQAKVRLSITTHDWRGLAVSERQKGLAALLQKDASTDFNLASPPLMRHTIIQTMDDAYTFIWSHHHLLLDGWSVPILLKEVFAFYGAFCRGSDLEIGTPRPYRDYIVWLKKQDTKSAESVWRRMLGDFTAPTVITDEQMIGCPAGGEHHYGEETTTITSTTVERLRSIARSNELTLNTLLQGAWAILLAHHAGSFDVLFGATVSGRPAQLRGVESMVGMFINTLPVRACILPDAPLVDWLALIQSQQVEARQYEYSSLGQIQACSGVPRGVPLFESILVFENLPATSLYESAASPAEPSAGPLSFSNVKHSIREDYPLILAIEPGSNFLIQLRYDRRRYSEAKAARILRHFDALLSAFIANEYAGLISFMRILDESDRREREANQSKLKQARQDKFKGIKRKAVSKIELKGEIQS